MRRRLLNLLAGLSLPLFAAVIVLWVRSHFVQDVIVRSRDAGGATRAWVSRDGRFGTAIGVADPATGRLMMMWQSPDSYWSAAAFLAIPPFLWLLDWAVRRELRRRDPGRCPACGYDLRATPERCPECGRPAAATEPTAEVAP